MRLLSKLLVAGLFFGAVNPPLLLAALKDTKKTETISWPIPWKGPVTLVYDVEYINDEIKNGEQTGFTMRYESLITTRPLADGYEQTWIDRNYALEMQNLDPMMRLILDSMIKAISEKQLVVDLDKNAELVAVRDLDGWVILLKRTYQNSFENVVLESIKTLEAGKQEAAKNETMKQIQSMIDALTTPSFVSEMLEEEPEIFNSFGSGSYTLNQIFKSETEIESPFGGEPYPATLEVAIRKDPKDPNFALAVFTSEVDGKKARTALIHAIKVLFPDKKDIKDDDEFFEKELKGIEIRNEVMLRINIDSGIAHEVKHVKKKKLPTGSEVETTRMRLRVPVIK